MDTNYNLRAARVKIDLTQADMAGMLGITRQTYQMKENGLYDFTTTEVNDMIRIFRDHGHDYQYEDIFLP